jgi:CBS domain-containing protein
VFLLRGAGDAHRHANLRERLDRRSLRDVMERVPPALSPDLPLDAALAQVQERPSLLWPVGDPVTGVLLLEHIDGVASADWPTTTVRDVAVPAERATVDVTTALDDAVARLPGAPGTMLVVTDRGRAVGLLTPSLVADLLG